MAYYLIVNNDDENRVLLSQNPDKPSEYFATDVVISTDAHLMLSDGGAKWTPKLKSGSTDRAFSRIMGKVLVIKPGKYDFYAENVENVWSLYVGLKEGEWRVSNHEQIQRGVMIQAWNWSFDTVRMELDNLKKAGYTTIQVSPIQWPKDYSQYDLEIFEGNGSATGNWWKMYQPLNFDFAPDADTPTGAQSFLGGRSAFEWMVNEAHARGLKVIVDVVVNHMADDTGNGTINPEILRSGEIKDWYFRWYEPISDYNNDWQLTKGSMGQPDLKTEIPEVQGLALSLLKKCVDAGADGFRFDAAKHIETPYDRDLVKSDFWPNVLEMTEKYALEEKQKTLYYYGEILDGNGGNRNYGMYIPFMNITDNAVSNSARDTWCTGPSPYVDANYAVLWAESHDNFAHQIPHGEYGYDHRHWINRTWALVAGRAKFTSLYFAPAMEMGHITKSGMIYDTFKWPEVAAINRFHNEFSSSQNEYYSDYYGLRMVERYDAHIWGAVIINADGTGANNVGIPTHIMDHGLYFDTITGNVFNVEGNYASGRMGDTGIAVLARLYRPGLYNGGNGSTTLMEDTGFAFELTTYVHEGDACIISSNGRTEDIFNFGYYSLTDSSKDLFTDRGDNLFVAKSSGVYHFKISAVFGEYKIEVYKDTSKAAILFDLGENVNGSMAPHILNHGHNTDIKLNKNLATKNGHVFEGWTKTPNSATVEYEDGATIDELDFDEEHDSVVLYAIWESTNNVTFNMAPIFRKEGSSGYYTMLSGLAKLKFAEDATSYIVPKTAADITIKNGGTLVDYNEESKELILKGDFNTVVSVKKNS